MSAANSLPGVTGQAAAGEEILVLFDQATVDLDSLQRGAYAVAAQMTVDIRISGSDYVCTIFSRESSAAADELKHRFRSEVNDQILRARIARETEPLRNLIFALAFSRTGLADSDGDPDAVVGA